MIRNGLFAAVAATTALSVSAQPPGARGSAILQRGGHSVAGIVFDSLHGRPLAAAEVILDGTRFRTVTDSSGRFRFDSVGLGSYRIALFHPLLDTLSMSVATRAVSIPLDSGMTVSLAIPSPPTLVRLLCKGRAAEQPGSILAGRVLDPDTEQPVSGASVFLSWTDYTIDKSMAIVRTPRKAQAVTDADGSYRMCGLPATLDALLVASRGAIATPQVQIEIRTALVAIRSLTLSVDTALRRERNAALTGTIRTASGEPLAGARVTVPGTGAATVSSAEGRFAISGLPSGTRNVVVRQVGFVPLTVAVDFTTRRASQLSVALEKQVQMMNPVLVKARRDRALASVGFSDRKKGTLGSFVTRSDFEKRQPRLLSDILRTMRGVRVDVEDGRPVLRNRRDGRGCVLLVIDGMRWESFTPGDTDDAVSADDIAAIEVYSGSTVPPEFEGLNRGCLTVVIWTLGRIR